MVASAAASWIVMCTGGVELVWLTIMHQKGLIKWEPIWVIFISALSYLSEYSLPNSPWAKPQLTNGEYVDWSRVAGWMATCPVLILFLVSMTTYGKRQASVRVVPLLVANQVRTPGSRGAHGWPIATPYTAAAVAASAGDVLVRRHLCNDPGAQPPHHHH